MSAMFVYVTSSSREEALGIGRALVAERLAACANVLDGATSVFRWEGRVQEEGEVALIAKTTAVLVETVIARVRELHSYECPCVIAWPITTGNTGYLEWIESETGGDRAGGTETAR